MNTNGRETSHAYSSSDGAGSDEMMGMEGNLTPTLARRKGSRRMLWTTPRSRWTTHSSLRRDFPEADTEYWSATLSR